MRVTTPGGRTALLTYCANVHPGESLDEVLAALERWVLPVRHAVGADQLGAGLWLSRSAAIEVERRGIGALADALAERDLFVFTLNGFPYGDFHAPVVKRTVYHPDWSRPERRRYTLALAEILAELLPPDVVEGTLSTLPLGHRDETDESARRAALDALVSVAADLDDLAQRSGRRVRLCVEPEPGCWLETTDDAIRAFDELQTNARAKGVSDDVIERHLGVCFDACHHAVSFEDPSRSLARLRDAGVVVGKVQLSSALRVPNPASPEARAALAAFDEPRFLHQVRVQRPDGLAGVDDLPLCSELPTDAEWRIHFHVPIHRDVIGAVGTTRTFVEETLRALTSTIPLPHLEVETYTWSVLPEGERPRDDAGLVRGLAGELAWARERIA